MPQMAFIANAEGEILFFNKRWYDYIGNIEGTEGEGWKDKHILHPDDLKRTIIQWEHSVRTGKTYDIEYRLRRDDGQYRWHLGRANPVRNKKGEIVKWVGTNTDIHDQKTSQELSQLIIESIPHGIWRCDPDGAADYCSKRFCEMVGHPVVEMLGWGWTKVIHPEDREKVLVSWQKARAAKEPISVDFRVMSRDGSYRWHLSLGNPLFDSHGTLIHYYGTWTDIHQDRVIQQLLAESEAKFKTITEATPQIVWTTTPNGDPDYFNQRWYEFTGLKEDTFVKQEWIKLLHPEDQQRARESWHQCYTSGEDYQSEFRLRHHSGNFRWVLARSLPVLDEQGKILRWLGTCTDIQEQKDLQDKLFSAITGRDEFISIASHELKNPLTSLRLICQMVHRNITKTNEIFFPEKMLDFTGKINLQIDHLMRLVDDMLDVSRIQSGRLMIKKEKMDIVKVLNDVLERMIPQFEEAHCPVPKKNGHSSIKGFWDPVRIEQVLINLISNAFKYGQCRPVDIDLEPEAKSVHIRIEDHGEGISKEDLTRIFGKFERSLRTKDISGMGLGLYISKNIVEAHQGKIWAESSPGNGSTFHIELPYGE